MVAEGQTVKQIALRLGISAKTADANRRKMMDKLSLTSTAEVVKHAVREGLTSVDF
jgi:DNA-binding NarL/FixJ family response regulator